MRKRRKQAGFTLLELLTVTAVLGTLASIAIPAYQQYSLRARFSEAILATTPFKNAIEIAAFRGGLSTPAQFNSGQYGIPDMIWPMFGGNQSQLVGVFGGRIIVIWWFDGSPLSGHTYTMEALNHEPPIRWREGGSCFSMGWC